MDSGEHLGTPAACECDKTVEVWVRIRKMASVGGSAPHVDASRAACFSKKCTSEPAETPDAM